VSGQVAAFAAKGDTSHMAGHGLASANGPSPLPELVVIGCSRGGLAALTEVLSALPANFPAAVLVVQHLAADFESRLAEVLDQRTSLGVQQAQHGVRIEPGVVYVAPPDQHLTLSRFGRIQLDRTREVNFSRPAVDTLFRSAAEHFGKHVIAILLSGFGKDGAAGAAAVSEAGGVVIVESEASARDFGMASAAIETGSVSHIMAAKQIPSYLQHRMTVVND
jgi:two-component system, chemotaxis family, protein-glutamate methylesterase/glutaminase